MKLSICCFVVLSLIACHRNDQPAAPDNLSSDQNPVYLSSNGCFKITSDFLQQAKINDYFNFEFRVTASCVPASSITKIDYYAVMPAHQHGMNSMARIETIAPGQYQVLGSLFHMPGQWQATLEIYYDNRVEIVTVDFSA